MKVKVCGLRSRGDIRAALEAGADYGGFVHFERSPRHLSLGDAKWLAGQSGDGLTRVALMVDPEPEQIEAFIEALPVEILQLHGSESPDQVAALRETFGLKVMKAIGVGGEADLARLDEHEDAADMLLVDARAAPEAVRPGGLGQPFDWELLRGRVWRKPWLLAGGLTAENVAEAIAVTGAEAVDVSSGVETEPGLKDAAKMGEFVRAARGGESA